jgi:hypothetical protein
MGLFLYTPEGDSELILKILEKAQMFSHIKGSLSLCMIFLRLTFTVCLSQICKLGYGCTQTGEIYGCYVYWGRGRKRGGEGVGERGG